MENLFIAFTINSPDQSFRAIQFSTLLAYLVKKSRAGARFYRKSQDLEIPPTEELNDPTKVLYVLDL